MRQRYLVCKCSPACMLKLRVNSCLSSEHHEIIIGLMKCIDGINGFHGKIGMADSIKHIIQDILDDDSDITPKQILMKLSKLSNKKCFDKSLTPSLLQVYIFLLLCIRLFLLSIINKYILYVYINSLCVYTNCILYVCV